MEPGHMMLKVEGLHTHGVYVVIWQEVDEGFNRLPRCQFALKGSQLAPDAPTYPTLEEAKKAARRFYNGRPQWTEGGDD
jgi:hypothetical protein